MKILVAQDLKASTLIKEINDKNVRGCSVDLTIGLIYRPGVKKGELGSATAPYASNFILNEGETALIQTSEELTLDLNYAAFVFPSSHVSIQGLLMTNPGHVDPGYNGKLHVTVINMGREPFCLRPGDRFLRAIFCQLEKNTDVKLSAYGKIEADVEDSGDGLLYRFIGGFKEKFLGKKPAIQGPVNDELLSKLSPDFLSVQARATEVARREMVSKGRWEVVAQYALPALIACAAGYGTHVYESSKYEERLKKLEILKIETRLGELEYKYPTSERLNRMEDSLKSATPTLNLKRSSSNKR